MDGAEGSLPYESEWKIKQNKEVEIFGFYEKILDVGRHRDGQEYMDWIKK